jgi:hypothetical protein
MDTERLALDIKAAIKAEYTRGEPSAQLIDRLLAIQLINMASTVRKAARTIEDIATRERLRDYADDLDPSLR